MQRLLILAGLALATAATAAPRDDMAQRVKPCTVCHGAEGRATNDGYFPRIAGKPAGYLHQQLLGFRDGRRQYGPMTVLVDHLSDDYLREMAEYFAALSLPYPPPQPPQASPAQLERGRALVQQGDAARELPACAQCHGSALTGVAPAIPGLLGLPRDYLNGQIGLWRLGDRRALAPDCMADIAKRLSPEDIGAVSAWLAAQAVPADARPATALPAPLPQPCGSVARRGAAQ